MSLNPKCQQNANVILTITGFFLTMFGFVMNMTGFAANTTKCVLRAIGIVLNIAEFPKIQLNISMMIMIIMMKDSMGWAL